MTLSPTAPSPIIVVGAGIIGATIAFQLARHGAPVTVIEAGQPGRGATAASLAWINGRDKNPRHYHDLNRRSLDIWPRLARQLGDAVDLTWGGELRWAATPVGGETLRQRVHTLQGWGYPIRLLEAEALPALEPALATGPLSAASYTPIDGHVDTGKVIAACLAGAAERGAVIHRHTKVTGLKLAPTNDGRRRVEAVRVTGDELPCQAVVLAAGPDTPELATLAGLTVPVQHTFGATVITEPLPQLFQTAAVIHTPHDREPQLAIRQLAGGELMIHAGSAAGSLGRSDEEVAQIMPAAARFFPALAGVAVKEVRRARRPIPQDGQPIIGFTAPLPNLYLAAMHSGVSLAALVGEFAAIEIVDGVKVDLLEPFRLERFG